jgi:hypothetical protein
MTNAQPKGCAFAFSGKEGMSQCLDGCWIARHDAMRLSAAMLLCGS